MSDKQDKNEKSENRKLLHIALIGLSIALTAKYLPCVKEKPKTAAELASVK